LKAEQNEAIARVKELGATLEGVNMHILDPKSCGDPENCVLNKQLAEYRRKTNTAHDIAEWLREHKALGVVKDSNGKDKVFNSIEIPSLRKRK